MHVLQTLKKDVGLSKTKLKSGELQGIELVVRKTGNNSTSTSLSCSSVGSSLNMYRSASPLAAPNRPRARRRRSPGRFSLAGDSREMHKAPVSADSAATFVILALILLQSIRNIYRTKKLSHISRSFWALAVESQDLQATFCPSSSKDWRSSFSRNNYGSNFTIIRNLTSSPGGHT